MHRVLEDPSIAPYESLVGRDALRTAIDAEFDRARSQKTLPPYELLVARICERVEVLVSQSLRSVINATGVLLHTNLGRAPLAHRATSAALAQSEGYSNLEYDLIAGKRGSRYERLCGLLHEVTGAEDALVVNNNAAAILLVVDTYARGLEIIVARSELIEVGGGFRLPEVLARSGATLVEVGATNRVYAADFAAALSPRTALLMRSHPSNYRIEGFTHGVRGDELATLAHRVGVPIFEDLGSGALVDLAEYGLPHERTVREALAEGAAMVAFSGDKLLGGPQAGIIVGTHAYIARLRSNPLLRALRVDKVTIALLAETLRLYRSRESREEIPLYRMLGATLENLRARADRYVGSISGGRVVNSSAYLGGGSLPGSEVASVAIAFATPFPDELAARLRRNSIPIVARIVDGSVLLDLRTIAPSADPMVIAALHAIEIG